VHVKVLSKFCCVLIAFRKATLGFIGDGAPATDGQLLITVGTTICELKAVGMIV
jgi:hypothetical protein